MVRDDRRNGAGNRIRTCEIHKGLLITNQPLWPTELFQHIKLRQQESNLRWGSQSPLPYRLAMAHHAKQYNIFSAFPQEVRRVFFARRPLPSQRFLSFFRLCGRDFAFSISCHFFTKGKFCGMRFSKNTARRGTRFILQR